MKKFFNWVFVLAGCVGLFYFVGLIVPRSMTRGCRTTMTTDVERVYAAVADLSTWPEWHPDVRSVVERGKRGENPLWRITERDGTSYELEVTADEEPTIFQVVYTIDGSRYTQRFTFNWAVHIVRTVDTRDPWMRAKSFLWGRTETGPVGLLNALAEHFGEAVKVQET